MGISTAALIPLILMCFLIAGGVFAFAKILRTPEPSLPSAYYMYSNDYETGRNTSLVAAPERAHVRRGDVERGTGSGVPSVRQIRDMAYAGQGQARGMSLPREGSLRREGTYGSGGRQDRAYDQRGYEQRGNEQRGYEQRGYDQRGYEQRVYDQRVYDQRGYEQRGYNGDRPYVYPGERELSPTERAAMDPGERVAGRIVPGNTQEMVQTSAVSS